MTDISHYYGNDLQFSATGDLLLTATPQQAGEQRVIRRLLTSPGAYTWNLNYGAGLPLFLGNPLNRRRIAAVARSQMYRERAVTRNPAPAIKVSQGGDPNSIVLSISYKDAVTQSQVVLSGASGVPGLSFGG